MSFQNDLPIIQKIYNLYKLFYAQIDHLPKKSRQVLTLKIEQLMLELFELFSLAETSSSTVKIQHLNKASVKLDFLKVLIRMLYELKAINQPKYLEFETHLQEIGKMLGGWIKSLKG